MSGDLKPWASAQGEGSFISEVASMESHLGGPRPYLRRFPVHGSWRPTPADKAFVPGNSKKAYPFDQPLGKPGPHLLQVSLDVYRPWMIPNDSLTSMDRFVSSRLKPPP